MKLIRVFFFIVLLAAVFDVAVCVVCQVNPLGSLVLVIIAGSSVVLVDYLDGPYRQRVGIWISGVLKPGWTPGRGVTVTASAHERH
jgi:hypothetical protein